MHLKSQQSNPRPVDKAEAIRRLAVFIIAGQPAVLAEVTITGRGRSKAENLNLSDWRVVTNYLSRHPSDRSEVLIAGTERAIEWAGREAIPRPLVPPRQFDFFTGAEWAPVKSCYWPRFAP